MKLVVAITLLAAVLGPMGSVDAVKLERHHEAMPSHVPETTSGSDDYHEFSVKDSLKFIHEKAGSKLGEKWKLPRPDAIVGEYRDANHPGCPRKLEMKSGSSVVLLT